MAGEVARLAGEKAVVVVTRGYCAGCVPAKEVLKSYKINQEQLVVVQQAVRTEIRPSVT